jgi:signal transduction histidine kinase
MHGTVPKSAWQARSHPLVGPLGLALDALIEFTNASCGWVGCVGTDGRLTFPVRRGSFPDAWLHLQAGQGVWGFAIREGPTLLNDLPAWPALGAPPLANLLSSPLLRDGRSRGHVALANKATGFTSHDAAVVQGIAHLMSKQLGDGHPGVDESGAENDLPWHILGDLGAGVLVLNDQGKLVYVNETWCAWTGFAREELLHAGAPLPFWISHRELAALDSEAKQHAMCGLHQEPNGERTLQSPVYPFRRRDDSRFWCHVDAASSDWKGSCWTVALLRPVSPSPVPEPPTPPSPLTLSPLLGSVAASLPFAVVLTDRAGRIQWTNSVAQKNGFHASPPGETVAPALFRDQFALASAAALEQLMRDPAAGDSGPFGRLLLEGAGASKGHHWIAYWLALPAGPAIGDGGYLFAFAEDWEGLCPPDDLAAGWRRTAAGPAADWLALLLRPGDPVAWWDERWEKLTAIRTQDVARIPGEVVVDWLFPRQADRDFVADLLHQADARAIGRQAILDVVSPSGSHRLLCTFLPVGQAAPPSPPEVRGWVMLIGEPQVSPAGWGRDEVPTTRYVRHFTRGLSHLLNHYLTTPIGLAEMALDRTDLPPSLLPCFEQILESCRQGTYLISALQDLAAGDVGETNVESLASIVREQVDERRGQNEIAYQAVIESRAEDVLVRINRRMIRVVLRHLLTNAEQAVANSPTRRILIRLSTQDADVCCAIEDTGEGLATDDWTALLAPFYSTKGPFARDAVHAAQPGTGLGLTVCHHLLKLHGGRLELQSKPGEGTTAVMLLPRNEPAKLVQTAEDQVRADSPSHPRGPHTVPGLPSAVEPPT